MDVVVSGKIRGQGDVGDGRGVDISFGIAHVGDACLLQRGRGDVVAAIGAALLHYRTASAVCNHGGPAMVSARVGGKVESAIVRAVGIRRAIGVDGHAGGKENATV